MVRHIPSGYLRARLDVVEARALLAPLLPFVDPALETGDNFFTIPLYRAPRLTGPNSLRLHPRRMRARRSR